MLYLVGNRYDLIAMGGPRSQGGTGRDTMGDDYFTTYYWFEGEGKLVDKKDGRETPFKIHTRANETGRDQDIALEDLVFLRLLGCRYPNTRVAPGQEPAFADFVAEQMLLEFDYNGRSGLLPSRFEMLDFSRKCVRDKERQEQLVARGIFIDENGQAAMPGLSVA